MEEMNKQETKYLLEVYKDCLKLERQNQLTEHGAGMGELASILLKKHREFKHLKEREKLKCLSCKKAYWVSNEERCVFCDSKKVVKANAPLPVKH